MRTRFAAAALAVVLASSAAPVHADWLSRLARIGEHGAASGVARGATALERAAGHLSQVPAKTAALAAELSREGHWTFVNRAGERFTAANADELRRAVPVLIPEAAKSETKFALYLTEDSLFRERTRLRDLPANADLRVLSGATSYRFIHAGEGAASRAFVALLATRRDSR